MSNTKEEILDNIVRDWATPVTRQDCYEAMEEFSKQQIISYEIWLEAELNNDSSFNYNKTPEQLYDLFQSQQNK